MNADELRDIAVRLSKLTDELLAAVDGRQPLEDPIQQFMDEGHAYEVRGSQVPFSEFYSSFKNWLPQHARATWTKAKLKSALRYDISYTGRGDQPRMMIEGVSFKPAPTPEAVEPERLNPDYDGDTIYRLASGMRKASVSNEQIADQLNQLGHRDKHGDLWTPSTARDASWD